MNRLQKLNELIKLLDKDFKSDNIDRLQKLAGITKTKTLCFTGEGCFYIDDSPIHGKGLFSKIKIPANTYVMRMGDVWTGINIFAQHINHTKNGNTTAVVIEREIYLYSLKNINPEEEVTSDYTKLPSMFVRDIEGFV